VGYRAQALVDDVLLSPGEVDITSHVNFDDLDHAVMDAGWQRGPLLPLGVFMTLHGALELLPDGVREGAPLGPGQWAELSAAKRLLMPTGLGTDLKLLAHGRGRLWQIYEELATPPPDEA
jgi:SAM-dependent MidA family methyltransferase